MPRSNQKVEVRLTVEQRKELQAICCGQSVAAAKVRRARILLMSDQDHADGRRRDWEIADAVGISLRQVVRIRQQFVKECRLEVVERKPRPPQDPKLDGKAEAMLVSLCCGTAPDGRERWTLQLLCDELQRLKLVESVCRETVRKTLKKTSLSPGGVSGFASPKKTAPGLLRGWKKSSTSTRGRTIRNIR